MKNSYKIRVRSFEKEDFSTVSELIKDFSQKFSCVHKGPVPLPNKSKLFTVNRSHHVHKKSRDQFILQTHSRLWVLKSDQELSFESLLKDLAKIERISYDWQLSAKSF